MPIDIDYDNLPPFPKRIPEKLKAIRERLGFSPDQIARHVAAKNGVEIAAYERDGGDVPVSALLSYARMADVPIRNTIDDDCDLWFGHRQN